MAIKLSNVIGAPFSNDVLRQLSIRARRNSTVTRSNEEVLFLANKTAWARLVSSVDIQISNETERKKFYESLQIPEIGAGQSLATNWVLEAGTSIQNGNGISLRQGIGPNGAYGLGGTQELGYRPMPGLTSITVDTTGRLGSLRQATISFKVWNMNQLNVIEALYFRLGYSMLLEWGHTQYFSNKNSNGTIVPEGMFVQDGVYGIDNPFDPGVTKETIQQAIARKVKKTSGNYDGMLGIVSNFNWSFNQEGGYDCTVRLVGLGAVMDSMRINQLYTLPPGAVKKFKESQSILEAAQRLLAEANRRRESTTDAQNFNYPPTPNSEGELYQVVKRFDGYTQGFLQFLADYKVYRITDFRNSGFDDVQYINFKLDNPSGFSNSITEEANRRYGGLWIENGSAYSRISLNTSTEVYLDTDLLNQFADVYFTNRPTVLERAYDAPELISPDQRFLLYFDSSTRFYEESFQGVRPVAKEFQLNDPLATTTITLGNTSILQGQSSLASLRYDVTLGEEARVTKPIYFDLKAIVQNPEANYPVTRKVALESLSEWYKNGAQALITAVSVPDRDKFVTIKGEFQTTVVAQQKNGTLTEVKTINWYFETNNPDFILYSTEEQQQQLTVAQAVQEPNNGDAQGELNEADTEQITSSEGLQSALTAMLAIIQTDSQEKALASSSPVIQVDILNQTREFYQAGILDKVLTEAATDSSLQGKPFDVTQYALRGFNSVLMVEPELAPDIPKVSFNTLCKSYVVRYPKVLPDGRVDVVHYPVYIQLGYLLAFLNNMCLFYDAKEKTAGTQQTAGTNARPYVYLDFNPETNFCLTAPQQFSIDPSICLLPFEGTTFDYKSLFAEGIKTDNFFNPEENNVITNALYNYGYTFNTNNAYQGKIMNILLNTDYLLKVVKEFSSSDKEQSVNLQSFLEKIMVDVSKALGNINTFRIAYRDDSNTVQILDDQYVPKYENEPSILNRNNYIGTFKTDPILAGQLPVFEAGDLSSGPTPNTFSLAREFQFKTTLSTKLASMIAISAQANTGSVNAKDHSSLSYLNRNYKDRYKPYIQDSPTGNKGTNTNTQGNTGKVNEASNDQNAANLFNTHVEGIFSNLELTPEKVDMAKNYYIERMSKVKSLSSNTTAAPFIPADLEITIDGISGIIMGNAFTVPESRLPLSLKSEDGFTKVGFIVTGLTHTIESNQWLTRIKGQMIKLREDSPLRQAVAIKTPQRATAPLPLDVQATSIISSTPWSAAFISYVMNQAGVAFPSNSSHTGYAQSLRTNIGRYNFEVLNPAKTALQVGDIVVKNRGGNVLTFGTNPWTGFSHGDIVTSLTLSEAVTVGGNVGDKVKETRVILKNNVIQAPDYFVVLRPPANFVSSITQITLEELKKWRGLTELSLVARSFLRDYYSTVGIVLG